MKNCGHNHGRALCFECFRTGAERVRAQREAWAQRSLPFEQQPPRPLTSREIAHRRLMLEHLAQAAVKRA